MGRPHRAVLVLVLLLGLCACAGAPIAHRQSASPPCPTSDEHPTAELIFPRVASDRPGPGVSETDFTSFVNSEISPRFRDGVTVLDAQDLSPRPALGAVYGPAKVVVIILPRRADDPAQIDAVRAAYRRRFGLLSLVEPTQGCVGP
jgi:hypothetical protein